MAMKQKSLDLNMDHEIINLCETVQQKSVWINFFSIFHDSEERRENMVYNEPKQTNIVPYFCEYTLVQFIS
jgi:hypothetical protein